MQLPSTSLTLTPSTMSLLVLSRSIFW
jgi:hypothetical protein